VSEAVLTRGMADVFCDDLRAEYDEHAEMQLPDVHEESRQAGKVPGCTAIFSVSVSLC
jgi:hypothetical protein